MSIVFYWFEEHLKSLVSNWNDKDDDDYNVI